MIQAPRFSQLDYCSVIITNVERSREFYGRVLGLREINKPRTFDFVVLWYELGDETLHLLLKDQPDTLSPRHFALRVNDVATARVFSIEGNPGCRNYLDSRRRPLLHS